MARPAQPRPVILFHDVTHARAIAAAARARGIEVDAVSAPGAVRYLGATILKAIVEEAQLTGALVDCGSSSESVQLALAAGWKRLLFEATDPAYDKLQDLAKAEGAGILPRDTFLAAAETLDLLRTSDPEQRCKDFLKKF